MANPKKPSQHFPTAGPQTVWWALFSLTGRIRRSSYLLGTVLMAAIWWFVLAQAFSAPEDSSQMGMWLLILGLIAIGSIYVQFALVTKRLHDLGYGIKYAFLVVFLGYAFPGIGVLIFLWLVLFKSESTVNRFGPPPVLAKNG